MASGFEADFLKMTEQLPIIDHETVTDMLGEYEAAFTQGRSQKEIDDARIRLIFSLVHSTDRKHLERGRSLAVSQLSNAAKESPPLDQRELRYLAAVSSYKLRNYVESKRELESLLSGGEEMRQARILKGLVEEAIIRDGLIGVGAVVAGIAGIVVAAALSSRRK